MNLEFILSHLPIDFFFLVVDKFLDISLPRLPNFYSIFNPNLPTKNSGFLLSESTTLDFIHQTTAKSGHQAAIIPFKPSAKIDFICQKNNWIKISNPSSLNRLFEDKIKFSQIISKSHLPQIPSMAGPLSSTILSEAKNVFGLPLVTQTHHGWAGNSTHLVKDLKTIFQIIPQNTPIKISPYLRGYTLLNNCCETSHGLLQSPPALQYTGISPLTQNPFSTVGRQWPSLAPPKIIEKIRQITTNFSKILTKYKYRGFFGLDFLVSQNKVYLLECNPRLTASFAFYTDIELKNNLNPLFYFHLLEFCAPNKLKSLLKEDRYDNKDLVGSEITLKNSLGVTIKKHHDFSIFCQHLNPLSLDPSIIQKVLNEKD
jgi:predicted ATP-grasp superfamily ATP-dependent carboligase